MGFNDNLVNIDASHYSGDKFTSTVNPNSVNVNAMPLPGNNVQSAASYFPCPNGSCSNGSGSNQSGGKRTKINRRKINKISRMYKMKSKRHIKRMKSRLRSKYRRSKRHTRNNRSVKRRSQRGGYAQYQNNMPMTQTYSLGGQLSAANSALASPPPYQTLSNNTSCIDNYNHFTNSGFPSRGSY
jgi:hypothetical protein